ncbi:MAG: peptidoglycan-binding protein, partial [Patescibacteria group bacterium]
GGGGGGGASIDTTPPSVPSNTKISMSGNRVVITWSNPTDTDFRGITIIRKQGSSPTSRTDGNIIYNNNLQNFIDSIDSTKTFYYALYSYDANNNYSQPVILKAEPGQTSIVSQPAPTTQPTATIQPTVSGTGQIVIPSSVSSFTFAQYLTIGKSGDEVKKLQELLSANPTIYPQQQITGYYGPATQRAVQRFQETYGIASPSTPGYGEVGPSTRGKLNYFISYGGIYSPSTYSTSTTTSTKPLSKAELIAQLKELIRQIEVRILVLLEQLKKLKAGQQ